MTEVSIKLFALGQGLADGDKIALANAEQICSAARAAGMTVTVDMEDHTTTDSTLEAVSELRKEFPDTGAVLQAYLYRTEGDCRDLAYAGSRVRLCKGAYAEPESVAFHDRDEIDLSYVRCLKILMAAKAIRCWPRTTPLDRDRAVAGGRSWTRAGPVRVPDALRHPPDRAAAAGRSGPWVRAHAHGSDWYGYLVRRLAERPANLAFFARSLISKD